MDKLALTKALRKKEGQPVHFSTLAYANVLVSSDDEMPLAKLKAKPFTLVTGIANPTPLIQHLKDQGLHFDHLQFSDHHFFSKKELEKMNRKGLLVTTEKDYTRLKGGVDHLYFIRVSHKFLDDGEEKLLEQIRNIIRPGSRYSP